MQDRSAKQPQLFRETYLVRFLLVRVWAYLSTTSTERLSFFESSFTSSVPGTVKLPFRDGVMVEL